jgi:hypothetical protein
VLRIRARFLSDPARSGRKASGRAAVSWRRVVTASSMAARASSRRPRSASRSDWLFSDPARSGRKASGRAAASWRRVVTASSMAARASSRRVFPCGRYFRQPVSTDTVLSRRLVT